MDLTKPPVHVLLAEDDEDYRELFREKLTELSVTVVLQTVVDGEKLMGTLAAIDHLPPPHVIFLDINMPRKNGIECLKEIRSHSKFNNVPVFMFSTSDHGKDIEDTFGAGANFYIPKEVFFSSEKRILEKLFSVSYTEYLKNKSFDKFVLKKRKS